MRRVLAIAVFSGLAISGNARAPARGIEMRFASIDPRTVERTNVRVIFPDGTELRADRMVMTPAPSAGTSLDQTLADEVRVMSGRPGALAREYVLSGEVKLIFPAR